MERGGYRVEELIGQEVQGWRKGLSGIGTFVKTFEHVVCLEEAH